MFGACKACAELRRQNEYLQSLVDRLMVQTWPKPGVGEEEPVKVGEADNVAERIVFGDG